MTTYQNGGRNAASPDEHRGSWRPQDQPSAQSYAGRSNEDDRDYRSWRDRNYREEEDLHVRDPGRWEGSRGSELGYRDGQQGAGRPTERYGQGQSGYGAGRHGEERAHDRHAAVSASYEDRYQEPDERLGDGGYGRDDRRGYLGYETSAFPGSQRMGGPRDAGWSPGTSFGHSHGDAARRSGDTAAHLHRGTGPHRGKGPVGYQRSDERLREMISEALTDDDQLDASNIEVSVKNGEVTLSGTVDDRRAKRDAEDCAFRVSGIRDLQNQLRVKDDRQSGRSTSGGANPRPEHDALAQDKKQRS